MKTSQKNTILFALLTLLGLSYWGLSFQINNSSLLYFDRASRQSWSDAKPVTFEWNSFGHPQHSTGKDVVFRMPDAGAYQHQIVANLPHQLGGYALYVIMHDNYHETQLDVDVTCNGKHIDTLQLENATVHAEVSAAWHVPIPNTYLSEDENNALQITNKGGFWFGKVLLIPNLSLHKTLSYMLPFLVCLAIFFTMRCGFSPYATFALIALSVFPLFTHTHLFAKITPIQGMFFSDSREMIKHLLYDTFASDMAKHPIFLPMMNGLRSSIESLGITSEPLRAYIYVFSLIASLNIAVVWLFLRLCSLNKNLQSQLLLVYLLSFSVLTYSSIYETYMLTAFLSTCTLIAALLHRRRQKPITYAFMVVTCVCTLLSSFSAGIFLILAGWFSTPLKKFEGTRASLNYYARSMIKFAAVCTLFGTCALLGILTYYLGDLDFLERLKTFYLFLHDSHNSYASVQNFSLTDITHVFFSLLVKGIVNFNTTASEQMLYQQHAPVWIKWCSTLACLAILSLWVGALVGFLKSHSLRKRTWTVTMLVIFPYILFHIYFNPTEMLLYAVPLLLLILIGQAVAAVKGFGITPVSIILSTLLALQLIATLSLS